MKFTEIISIAGYALETVVCPRWFSPIVRVVTPA